MKNLITPRVRRSQRELLMALADAIDDCGLSRAQAEAQLSGLFCDVWNEAEELARRLPGLPLRRG